jgi:hypothetical protein
MKKILILLLITLGLTTYAQKNYSIERPLYLGTVNAGSAADSVLVRGADKIVKFVPRSEFGGGSGGTQNLQSVLNNGSEATVNENLEIIADDILFKSNDAFRLAVNEKYYRLDTSKPDGIYTLATLDDITSGGSQNLQSVLENGNEVYLPFFLSVGLSKYGVLQDNWNRYSVGVEKDGASLNFGVGATPQLNYRYKNLDNSLTENSFLFPHNGIQDKTIPISVNGNYADVNGNIPLSSITTTFTTNDGKTVTVTNGVITNVQ